jgi:hypothetical protein
MGAWAVWNVVTMVIAAIKFGPGGSVGMLVVNFILLIPWALFCAIFGVGAMAVMGLIVSTIAVLGLAGAQKAL